MSVNRVILLGNLGNKPELKHLASGSAVCTFSMATNEKWTDKDNQKQERVEWHRIVVWNKVAENCAQYLDKGRQVYIEGKLATRSWDDKDGVKRYTTEVVANTVQFLGGKGEGRAPNAPPPDETQAPSNGTTAPVADDDIPF